MNVQHSSRSDKWYTPVEIIRRSVNVLGRIDLDPASDEFGNSRVMADSYIDERENGLSAPWKPTEYYPISVFLNSPGGKLGNKSMAALFWVRLMKELEAGNIKHAIYIGFSAEQLQTSQGKGVPSLGDFYCCIPAKRIRFDKPPGHVNNQAPSHSNIIVYVPGTERNLTGFVSNFCDLGIITGPL